jgi:EAL domain-containing protein (putative c-di-GMP-specific phosphodiesterase class I)/DNA-binding NarL/FixJ family response regulator
MTEKRKLLILDDDPLTGQTLTAMAELSGCEVQLCDEPESFFSLLQSWQPDTIALDLMMPQMDGLEVIQELAKRECRAAIIIISGVEDRVLDAARRSALNRELKVIGTLTKPFPPKAFRDILANQPQQVQQKKEPLPASDSDFGPEQLQEALSSGGIRAVYQPKIRCSNRKLIGFEALARLRHPALGEVFPDQFIPIAEQHGLIDELTKQILKASLDWLKTLPMQSRFRRESPELIRELSELTLSINLSARSLINTDLFNDMRDYCGKVDLAAQRIILELTETSATEDQRKSLEALTRLRMQGFRLSIDDFGTGFSSMSQLMQLPFSEIKIDKSFVMNLNRSDESKAVTRSVVKLGQNLKLQVVAEGVENEETLQFLRGLDCHQAQGYLISKGLEAEQAADWIAQYIQHWHNIDVAN